MASGGRKIEVEYTGDSSDLDRASKDAAESVGKVSRSTEELGDTFGETASRSAQVAGGLGDLGGALSQMGGPLGAVGSGMELLGPSIMGITGAADLAEVATTKLSLANIKNAVSTAASTAASWAARAATEAWAAIQWVLNAALSANPIALVVIAIAALVAAIVIAYKNSETFRDIVSDTWQVIQSVVSYAWNNVLAPIFNLWLLQYRLMWQAAQTMAGIVGDAWGAISSGITAAWNVVSGIIGQLIDAVKKLPQQLASAAAGMWNFISDGFKGVINLVIGWWNNIKFPTFTIPKISIPFLGDFGGQSFGGWTLPPITPLATGGIVTRPTLALIGERGPEAVIPLSSGAASTVVNVYVDVPPTANPAETGRAVAGVLRSYFAAGGRLAVPA